MSTRHAKLIRKQIRKHADDIKIATLREFMEYSSKQGFWKRLRFAWRIIRGGVV